MKIFKRVYETIMVLLVMVTIMTLWSDRPYNSVMNWIVWAIFMVDFLTRLLLSNQKWQFIKKNPFLVVAVIPLDQFFQMARIVRIIYLFRIKTITKYYIEPFVNRLTYASKVLIFGGFCAVFLVEAFIIYGVEEKVTSYWESLFMVGRQLLFFGHQTDTVMHTLSIVLLVGTSILGVVLHGLALQWALSKVELLWKRDSKSNSYEDVHNNIP